MKNRFLVITSILSPTDAVKAFAERDDISTIVVGDKKTPQDWYCDNVIFLSEDKKLGYKIEKTLPFNHYARKMIGYIYAVKNNAEIIIDTDDDNIPKNNWFFPDFEGKFAALNKDEGFINVYKFYTEQHIWPRGFPLYLIKNNDAALNINKLDKKDVKIGVWQGLVDNEPDVDAIYRLTDNTRCFFNDGHPVVLQKGTLCPFNSQNTAYRKELFALMYLPATVTFRFTDILRGLIAQPIMWLYDYNLGFTQATAIQNRNEHDYLKDFESEIPCYLLATKVIDIVNNSVKKSLSVEDNLYNSYEALYKNDIVKKEELEILSDWLNDLLRG